MQTSLHNEIKEPILDWSLIQQVQRLSVNIQLYYKDEAC